MVFVTGGTGLVGSHLIFELLKQGKKVRALKRANSNVLVVKKTIGYYTNDPDQYFNQIEWVEGDLLNPYLLKKALHGAEEVYHAAGFVSFASKNREKVLKFNVQGTAIIIDICLEIGIRKFCHVSSSSAIGTTLNGEYANEECTWVPSKSQSVYSLSKFKAEMEVWRGITLGLNAVIVNPTVIIGPGNWKRSSPRMFDEIWKGIKFYTLGITGYVDVKDVVRCMVQLMDRELFAERYILSEGNYSYKQIFEMIANGLKKKKPTIHAGKQLMKIASTIDGVISKITGKEPVITKETVKAAYSKKLFSSEKIINTLNYQFRPIQEGIKEYASYFLRETLSDESKQAIEGLDMNRRNIRP